MCLFAIVVVSFLEVKISRNEYLSRRIACKVSLTRTWKSWS